MDKVEEIIEKSPVEDAPKIDESGRSIIVERVRIKEVKDSPEKTVVVVEAPGITIRADDVDGHGVSRALSTLAAMVSDVPVK